MDAAQETTQAPHGASDAPEAPQDDQGDQDAPQEGAHDAVWHQAATADIVSAWHSHPTASKYAHRGGSCGCRLLASIALVKVHGEPTEPVEVVDDAEPV